MPAHRTTRPRPRHLRRVLAPLAALIAIAALALPTTGAAAGPSTTTPKANSITLAVAGLQLPVASGTPEVLVLADKPFQVTVTLRAGESAVPYSTRSATDVRLAIGGSTLAFATVPAGQSSATATVQLAAANRVTIRATAVARKAASELLPGTVGPFDAVLSAKRVGLTTEQRGTSLFVNTAGATAVDAAVPCTATPEAPTCVDVLLPNGVHSDVFFSTGVCSGGIGCRDDNGIVLQVLADLGEGAGALYTRAAPATLIVRCDKTRCGGGSINDNTLQVNLDPVEDLTQSPPCSAKVFMSGPDDHCVDYVQSRRDGTGDTYLYLLITRDARLSH